MRNTHRFCSKKKTLKKRQQDKRLKLAPEQKLPGLAAAHTSLATHTPAHGLPGRELKPNPLFPTQESTQVTVSQGRAELARAHRHAHRILPGSSKGQA